MNKITSTQMNIPNSVPPENEKPMDLRYALLYVVAIAFSVITIIDLLG